MRAYLLVSLIVIIALACNSPINQPSSNIDLDYILLKRYELSSQDQESRLDQYLSKAYIPALHRHGVSPVGVFKDQDNQDSSRTVFVLTTFESLDHLDLIEQSLLADTLYLTDGSDYINTAYDNPVYDRIETTMMRSFSDMPHLKPSSLSSSRADRIYELRSYESTSETIYRNKVDMFNAGGEVILFDRLGFNAVFYGDVISGSKMPNLMYMTTHENMEVRDQNWKNFVASSEWKELLAMDKYKNNISHIDIYLLYPTEYSDY